MGACIIFCAGDFDRLIRPIEKSDYIIAADGGLAHVKRLGLSPNEILGDFDSLGYTPEGSTVFPAEKDDTDAMLAVRRDWLWVIRSLSCTEALTAPGWIIPLPTSRLCSFWLTMGQAVFS